jgi:hypothetical protein
MAIPIKVEVFDYDEDEPFITHHYTHFRETRLVRRGYTHVREESLQADFGFFTGFPSPERLIDVFIEKHTAFTGQKSLTKLWLDDDGNIITRIKISIDNGE